MPIYLEECSEQVYSNSLPGLHAEDEAGDFVWEQTHLVTNGQRLTWPCPTAHHLLHLLHGDSTHCVTISDADLLTYYCCLLITCPSLIRLKTQNDLNMQLQIDDL